MHIFCVDHLFILPSLTLNFFINKKIYIFIGKKILFLMHAPRAHLFPMGHIYGAYPAIASSTSYN